MAAGLPDAAAACFVGAANSPMASDSQARLAAVNGALALMCSTDSSAVGHAIDLLQQQGIYDNVDGSLTYQDRWAAYCAYLILGSRDTIVL